MNKILVFCIISLTMASLAFGAVLVTNNPSFESDPTFYKGLGNELAKRGNNLGAISAYEQSLTLAEDPNLRNNLAVLYYQQSAYSDAIRHLDILVTSNPGNPSYHYDLAVNLVDKFRHTEDKSLEDLFRALSEYEQAENLAPGFQNAKNNINVLRKVLSE